MPKCNKRRCQPGGGWHRWPPFQRPNLELSPGRITSASSPCRELEVESGPDHIHIVVMAMPAVVVERQVFDFTRHAWSEFGFDAQPPDKPRVGVFGADKAEPGGAVEEQIRLDQVAQTAT